MILYAFFCNAYFIFLLILPLDIEADIFKWRYRRIKIQIGFKCIFTNKIKIARLRLAAIAMWMQNIVCMYYMHCIHFIIFIYFYSMQYFLCIYYMHCFICMALSALFYMHYILCIVFYKFYYMCCILCILFYALYSIHVILCNVPYALYSMYCFLCIALSALFSMNYILLLYSMHCILCI